MSITISENQGESVNETDLPPPTVKYFQKFDKLIRCALPPHKVRAFLLTCNTVLIEYSNGGSRPAKQKLKKIAREQVRGKRPDDPRVLDCVLAEPKKGPVGRPCKDPLKKDMQANDLAQTVMDLMEEKGIKKTKACAKASKKHFVSESTATRLFKHFCKS